MTDALNTINASREGSAELQARYEIPDLPRLDRRGIEAVLSRLERAGGFSDIYISIGHPLRIKARGTIVMLNKRPTTQSELEAIVNGLYGANGSAEVFRSGELDFSTEFTDGEVLRRYRVNVGMARSPMQASGGLVVTMRSLASEPPRMEALNVEPEIVNNMLPRNGIVMVTGPTGSGKSTLLSACVRAMIENQEDPRAILTYEAPIEYTFDTIPMGRSFVLQSEVPTMCRSFALAVKSALRRNPDVVVLGEARDRETFEGACRFAQTGHLVLTTMHTNSVAETMRRVLQYFDPREQAGMLTDLIAATRMIVTQVLVPGTRKAQIGLREYLVFNDMIRADLFKHGADRIVERIEMAVRSHGQTMYMAARRAFEAGEISHQTFLTFENSAHLTQEARP